MDEYLVKNVTDNYLRFPVYDAMPERLVVLAPRETMRVFLPNVLGEQARIMAQAHMLRVTRDGHLGRIVDWPVQAHLPTDEGVAGIGFLAASAGGMAGIGRVSVSGVGALVAGPATLAGTGTAAPPSLAPTWGYTFDNTKSDLTGGNPLNLYSNVFAAWLGDPTKPRAWYQGNTSSDAATAAVADTGGGDCTLTLNIAGDQALGNLGKYIEIDTGRFRARLTLHDMLRLYNAAGAQVASTSAVAPINDTVYRHVAFVVLGSTLTVYIDGAAVYSGAEPAHAAVTSVNVFASGNTYGTVGCCDIFCWGRALSASEVGRVYSERSPRPWA